MRAILFFHIGESWRLIKPVKRSYPKKPFGLDCVICQKFIHWKQDDRVYQPLEDKINPGDLTFMGECGHIGHV